jgi:hypothetical protein
MDMHEPSTEPDLDQLPLFDEPAAEEEPTSMLKITPPGTSPSGLTVLYVRIPVGLRDAIERARTSDPSRPWSRISVQDVVTRALELALADELSDVRRDTLRAQAAEKRAARKPKSKRTSKPKSKTSKGKGGKRK